MRHALTRTLRASLLCAFCWLAAAAPLPAAAGQRTALPENDRFAVLSSVIWFGRAASPGQGPQVKVLGVGGGDPAMNGTFVYVCIEHGEKSLVWPTELNVREIRRVRVLPGNRIVLDVAVDRMDGASSIVTGKARYVVRFFVDGDVLRDRVTVEDGD